MPYPRIILRKQNGGEIHIDCKNLPTLGGGPVDLVIKNVELRHDAGKGYDYLYCPPGNGGPIVSGDIEIIVQAPIVENSLVLPFDGGYVSLPPDSANNVCIQARREP